MRISVKNGGSWTQTDALWMALSIDRHLRTQKDHPVILSFAGGGGKNFIYPPSCLGRERTRVKGTGNDHDPHGRARTFCSF